MHSSECCHYFWWIMCIELFRFISKLILNYYFKFERNLQSLTLTTGPKVLACKNGLGLVKLCNQEVQRAYEHFTGTCYTEGTFNFQSFNLTPLGKVFILWSWIGTKVDDSKHEIQRHGLPWYSHDSDTLKCLSSDTTVYWCLWILCDRKIIFGGLVKITSMEVRRASAAKKLSWRLNLS